VNAKKENVVQRKCVQESQKDRQICCPWVWESQKVLSQ